MAIGGERYERRADRPGDWLLALAVADTAVSVLAGFGWLALAAGMYLEAASVDPGEPEVSGHPAIALLACAVLVSLAVTWPLRSARRARLRQAAHALIAVRLGGVLLVTALLARALLDG
ncbi:hypothetical protein ACFQ6B_37715 [Streptomyces wedmorensis]|uniref:Uncharacterized protein n=1 Tax=Streptomyces wedmorensis TaxID=43759 RepID=A0ABW6IWM0_STRWE